MAKKNKNNKKSNPLMPAKGRPSRADVRKVCGMVNPFCEAAYGQKIPDGTGSMSEPVMLTERYVIEPTSTKAGFTENGAFQIIIQPDLYHVLRVFDKNLGTASGEAITDYGGGSGGTKVDQWTDFNSRFESGRIVTMGAHIYASQNTDEDRGFVTVRSIPTAAAYPGLHTYGHFLPKDQTFTGQTLTKGGIYIPLSVEDPARRLRFNDDLTETANTASNTGIGSVVVEGANFAVSSDIRVDIIVHVEARLSTNGLMGLNAMNRSPPASYSRKLLDAVLKVGNVAGITKTAWELPTLLSEVEAWAVSALAGSVPYAEPALLALL